MTSSHSILPHQAHVNKWILSSCSVISSGKESLRQEPTIRACLKSQTSTSLKLKIWRWIHPLISISAVKKRGSFSVIIEAKLCNTSSIYKSGLNCSGKCAVGRRHGNSTIAVTANFISHTDTLLSFLSGYYTLSHIEHTTVTESAGQKGLSNFSKVS